MKPLVLFKNLLLFYTNTLSIALSSIPSLVYLFEIKINKKKMNMNFVVACIFLSCFLALGQCSCFNECKAEKSSEHGNEFQLVKECMGNCAAQMLSEARGQDQRQGRDGKLKTNRLIEYFQNLGKQ